MEETNKLLGYELSKVDVVYTWVNGSDPKWKASFDYYVRLHQLSSASTENVTDNANASNTTDTSTGRPKSNVFVLLIII